MLMLKKGNKGKRRNIIINTKKPTKPLEELITLKKEQSIAELQNSLIDLKRKRKFKNVS